MDLFKEKQQSQQYEHAYNMCLNDTYQLVGESLFSMKMIQRGHGSYDKNYSCIDCPPTDICREWQRGIIIKPVAHKFQYPRDAKRQHHRNHVKNHINLRQKPLIFANHCVNLFFQGCSGTSIILEMNV